MSHLSDDQAMMLFQLMQHMAAQAEESEEEEDDRVQCPVCSKFHEPREGEEGAAKKGEPASHGCLVVYISHQCPICLEDSAGPPMIALPCGHLVCQPDFQKLGGYIGEKPSDQPRNDSRRRSRNNDGPGIRMIDMMRMIGMPPFGFPGPFDDEDEDDEDEDDEDEDTDDDDESLPSLENVGGGIVNDEDESDDSMPDLEPVRRTGNAEANDSDDDTLPPLQQTDGAVVEEEGSDDDDDDIPPLMPRTADSDSDEEDDSDDGMPPLIFRSDRGRNNSTDSSESEDIECPALEGVNIEDSSDEEPSAANVEDSDDGSVTNLNHVGADTNGDGRRNETREVDEADDISEIDEEEEVIPFPVLERVRGASRAPTTFTREEYLALPEAQRDFEAGGAWIMIPSGHNEDFSTLVYTNQDKCVHIGVFARESRLIVNNNESVLIRAPKTDSNQSDIWLVDLEKSERLYEVPTNAQCVSDADGGIWALTPTGGTKELSYCNREDCPTGSVVHVLPESSYIVMDPMGGVWAHVRKKGTVDMEPGLYFYAFGGGHSLISTIDQDAKCTTGADGVCIVSSGSGQAQLTNTVLGETPRPVILKNCAASKDIRVVPREKEEGDRTLYVHCRVKNRWKLCLLDESDHLSDICDCPKDARVVGDGNGGAWIFKRTGASHQMRMLTFVTSSGITRDHGLSFPPGSKMADL